MTDSWPVVADTETADLQEFVSEYKHNLDREALWKVARIVAGKAGVTLQAFDSRDKVQENQQSNSTGPDTAASTRAPGGFGGSLVAREGFDDPLDEDVLEGFEGRDAADAGEGPP